MYLQITSPERVTLVMSYATWGLGIYNTHDSHLTLIPSSPPQQLCMVAGTWVPALDEESTYEPKNSLSSPPAPPACPTRQS